MSHTREQPRGQPLPIRWPQGYNKKTPQKAKTSTHKKDPQKKHHLGTVSTKITGGLKHVAQNPKTIYWSSSTRVSISNHHQRWVNFKLWREKNSLFAESFRLVPWRDRETDYSSGEQYWRKTIAKSFNSEACNTGSYVMSWRVLNCETGSSTCLYP